MKILAAIFVSGFVGLVGCSKSGGLDDCPISVGTCNTNSVSCGVQYACKDSPKELRCTPPTAPDAKKIACQCVDNSLLGKNVELDYPLGGNAGAVGSSACGWKR